MPAIELSNYAKAIFEWDDANPFGIEVRASPSDSYGDLGRVYLTPDEVRDLTVWLVQQQADDEAAEMVADAIDE